MAALSFDSVERNIQVCDLDLIGVERCGTKSHVSKLSADLVDQGADAEPRCAIEVNVAAAAVDVEKGNINGTS